MERSSIQTKDTWDLSYIYQTNQEFLLKKERV